MLIPPVAGIGTFHHLGGRSLSGRKPRVSCHEVSDPLDAAHDPIRRSARDSDLQDLKVHVISTVEATII